MKKVRVSLMGGTGYAAAELIRRAVQHPNIELVRIASIDKVGENIGMTHRNFGNRLDYIFEDLTPAEVAKDCDVVFLALPHKVSYLKTPELIKAGVRIIDFSGDYRIRDVATYNKFYDTTHTNPENIESFVYGLPELHREEIAKATRIANPGCFATAITLGLLPLAKAGLLQGKTKIFATTGSTGGGVAATAGTHHPVRSLNMKVYKILSHQHVPEMEQTLTDAGAKDFAMDFIPISAPVSRGMLATSFVDLDPSTTLEDINAIFENQYKNEPFIRLLGNITPETISVAATNFCDIGWVLSEERNGTKTLAVTSVIDNLVKGAAGQAIHNMNIMMGLDEMAGLSDFGVWP